MEQFIEGQNPYEILELKDGQQSSLEAIKKVCRAMAHACWQLCSPETLRQQLLSQKWYCCAGVSSAGLGEASRQEQEVSKCRWGTASVPQQLRSAPPPLQVIAMGQVLLYHPHSEVKQHPHCYVCLTTTD